MSKSTFLEQAVFTAIWKGNLNGVKTLVDAKNIECYDQEHHRTPLSWSCFYGNKQITPYLLELGANLETPDKVTARFANKIYLTVFIL